MANTQHFKQSLNQNTYKSIHDKSDAKDSKKAASKKNTVTVKVLSQEYKIATDSQPDRAMKIAKYLNDSVQEILKKSPSTQSYNALVLAALNLAEKYFSSAEKMNHLKAETATRTKKILKLLDEATDL